VKGSPAPLYYIIVSIPFHRLSISTSIGGIILTYISSYRGIVRGIGGTNLGEEA
jgi:hypothetical protein